MFLLPSIWKRLSSALIIALLIGAGLFANAGIAHAAGEIYTWKDAADTVITASGGSYSAPVELKKASSTPQEITFSGKGTIVCAQSTAPATFTLTVDAAAYKHSDPTPSKAFAISSNCTSASFDSIPFIASATLAAAGSKDKADPDSCDAGSFSWAVCPFTTEIAKVSTSLATSALTPFLNVKPITRENTPGLYQTWSGVKNFADALFILIFLVIIFATATGSILDQYSIKRMLPRVIAAAILIQFSFIISGIIVDIGNIGGAGIKDVVNSIASGTPHANGGGWDITSNIITVIAAIVGGQALWHAGFLSLPVLGLIFLSIAAVFLTLVARFVLIAFLIALSPLAFVAWVLPNTQHYYKKWSTLFIRLILMYPIIIGIFSIARIIDQVITIGVDTSNSVIGDAAVHLLKPFIFIICFFLIPFAFKWAGGAMAHTQTLVGGLSRGLGGKIRNSESYQRSKEHAEARSIKKLQKFEKHSSIRSLTNNTSKGPSGMLARGTGKGLMSARAFAMGVGPRSPEALQKSYSKLVDNNTKYLSALEESQDFGMMNKVIAASYGTAPDKSAALKALAANAPSLMRYTETEAGRMAVIKKLADSNQVGRKTLESIRKFAPDEYKDALRAAGKGFKDRPTAFARFGEGEVEFDPKTNKPRATHKAGDVKVEALKGIVGGWDVKEIREMQGENWEIARLEKDVSDVFAEKTKYSTYDSVLSNDTRTRAQAPKRKEIFQWIGSRHSELESAGGNAAQIVNVARTQLDKNKDIYAELVKFAYEGNADEGRAAYTPGFTTVFGADTSKWTETQMKLYLDDWLNR